MSSEVISLYDLVPGKMVLDRFKIIGPHRQGGLSTAFEVSDSLTEERCELQLFPSGLFEGVEQVREFAATCEGWKRVSSPAVLGVREVLVPDEGVLMVISEFPFGRSLRKELNENERLDSDAVIALGRHLLEGLVEIHAHGLVHGDIKPHTIHVEGEGSGLRALLVDGGITPGLWTAKSLGEHTALIGTPYYAPIEQFGGESPDISSDIYNVATVLFEVAAGVLPWAGSSFLEVFQAKLDRSRPSISARVSGVQIERRLEDVIAGGLMADRKLRHATAQTFLDALSQV